MPRRQREDRAYKLVVATAGFGAISVVTFVLAIFGVMGFGFPILAAIVAVICLIFFRRTVSG